MGHIKDCAVSLDSFHVAMVIFSTCFNNSTNTKIKMLREGYTEENTVTLSSHLFFLSSYILPRTHEYTAFVCVIYCSCVAPHIKVDVVQLDYFFSCSSSVCLCN